MRSSRFSIAILALSVSCFAPTFALAQKGGGASAGQPQAGAGAQGGGQGATPYFETEMLAYGAVNQLAESIARQVCTDLPNSPKPTVVIFDQGSFQNVQAWMTFVSSAAAIKNAYETLLSPNETLYLFPPQASNQETLGLAFIPITSGSDLATLISTLASSTTNNASTFTIQDSTMAVSLAHQFTRVSECNGATNRTPSVNLVYYPLFGSYVDIGDATTLLTQTMSDLNTLRNYIQLNYAFSSNTDPNFQLYTDLNNQYDALIKIISSTPGQQSQSQGGGLQQSAQSGQTSGSSAASPPAGAGGGGAGGGQSVTSLLQGAMLAKLLKDPETYVLYADVVAAGGTQRDRKNLFTLITGDWISYSGGLVVNVALVRSSDTSLKFADTLRYRSGYAHIRNPRQSGTLENTNSGENETSVCGQEHLLDWERYSKDPCPRQSTWAQAPAPAVAAVALRPQPSIVSGGGTIRLYLDLPGSLLGSAGDLTISSSNSSVATVSTTATNSAATINISVQANQSGPLSATVNTSSVSIPQQVKISAAYSQSGTVIAKGDAMVVVSPPVSFSRTNVSPGWHGSVIITLPAAYESPQAVQLTQTNTDAISLDSTVVSLGTGVTQGSVGFTAKGVTASSQSTITASLGDIRLGSATITVTPPVAPN